MVKSSSPNAPSTWLIFLCPRTHAKTSLSLTFIRTREREKVHCKCTMYFIKCWQCLTVRNLSIKLYHIYVCYTNITLYVYIFFLSRYNFREVSAFSTNSFYLDRFLLQSFQLFIFAFITSFVTSSSHLFWGLPSGLDDMGVHSFTLYIAFVQLNVQLDVRIMYSLFLSVS
jgi:hypothetical protein